MAGSFSLRDIIDNQANATAFFGLGGILSMEHSLAAPSANPRLPLLLRSRVGGNQRSPLISRSRIELVAGFHTEYASFKFAMFFIGRNTPA